MCGRSFGLCLKQRVCVFHALIYVYSDQVLDIKILLRYMYIVKAIPNYPNQQYICVCIITTSIAHRIKNPPRRTSERFVKNVSWSSKINGSFSHNYVAASDFTAS